MFADITLQLFTIMTSGKVSVVNWVWAFFGACRSHMTNRRGRWSAVGRVRNSWNISEKGSGEGGRSPGKATPPTRRESP